MHLVRTTRKAVHKKHLLQTIAEAKRARMVIFKRGVNDSIWENIAVFPGSTCQFWLQGGTWILSLAQAEGYSLVGQGGLGCRETRNQGIVNFASQGWSEKFWNMRGFKHIASFSEFWEYWHRAGTWKSNLKNTSRFSFSVLRNKWIEFRNCQ